MDTKKALTTNLYPKKLCSVLHCVYLLVEIEGGIRENPKPCDKAFVTNRDSKSAERGVYDMWCGLCEGGS